VQTFKVILGSTAFFLCVWLTTGLLGNSLFEPLAGDCAQASEPHRYGGSIRVEDILKTLCLVHGESPGAPGRIRDAAGQDFFTPQSGEAAPALQAG